MTLCTLCPHAAHQRPCQAIVDNGWTWHGCHCEATPSAPQEAPAMIQESTSAPTLAPLVVNVCDGGIVQESIALPGTGVPEVVTLDFDRRENDDEDAAAFVELATATHDAMTARDAGLDGYWLAQIERMRARLNPSYGDLADRDPAWCMSSPDGTGPHRPDDTTDPLTCAECGAMIETDTLGTCGGCGQRPAVSPSGYCAPCLDAADAAPALRQHV